MQYTPDQHVESLLSFVTEYQRKRVEKLIRSTNPKQRRKLDLLLDHNLCFEEKYAFPANKFSNDKIFKFLTARGATTTCYVISSNNELSFKEWPLREALDETIGFFDGTFISCVPGKLAFHEYEDIKQRVILEKK